VKIPKDHLDKELLRQVQEKKVVRRDGCTFRDVDAKYVEVSRVRRYRESHEMPETYERWVLHG
jgi:hypothetical protein